MSAYVVTSTDRETDKSLFAAALAGTLGAHYWKPVQAASAEGTDLALLTGIPAARILPATCRLDLPLAPHTAASRDGHAIDPDQFVLPTVRPLVIEAAGGALTPLTCEVIWADIFAEWGLLTILAARAAPDSIDHSLKTIEALRVRRVPIHGIAFVGEANEDSEEAIAAKGQVRRLSRLPQLATPNAPALATAFAEGFRTDDFA